MPVADVLRLSEPEFAGWIAYLAERNRDPNEPTPTNDPAEITAAFQAAAATSHLR